MFKNILNKLFLTVISIFLGGFMFAQNIELINELIEKSNQTELKSKEYLTLIKHFSESRQYANGLVYSEKLIELCKKNKDSSLLVIAINKKAENLSDLGKVKEGIEFCETRSVLFRKQDSNNLELLYFKWGMLYYGNKEYKKAHQIYQKIKSKNYRETTAFRNNFSIIHSYLGNYDSASYYLKIMLQNKNLEQYTLYLANSNLGYYALKQKKYYEAMAYFDSAKIYIDIQNYRSQKSLFTNYYSIHKELGFPNKAFMALDSINKYNELIFEQKLNEEIQELKNASRRELNLKQKVKVVDGKIERYERQFWVWFALICILIVSIVFYLFYRNVKSKNNQIVLEQKLLRSQMTPHFIFNSLSVVQCMILNKENTKAVHYLSKFSKLIRLILENSRDKLVPLEDELNAVRNYLDLQSMQMTKTLVYSIDIDKSMVESNLLIPPMLIQPFVENAIEHGFKGGANDHKISILLSQNLSNINCEIIDNGIGVSQINKKSNSNKKSVSTAITAERLALLSKQYRQKSGVKVSDRKTENKQGTKVILTLPIITN